MKKILIIGRAFPNAAHGYINNDVEFIASKAEVLVLSPNQPMAPYYSPVTFNYFNNRNQLIQQACEFNPDFIVSWLLPNHHYAKDVAEAIKVPFVLKLHTPDWHALKSKQSFIRRFVNLLFPQKDNLLSKQYLISKMSLKKTANSKYLLGVYCISVLQKPFSDYFPPDKIYQLNPRIFYEKFHNEHENGDDVFLLGSLLNRREGFLSFSKTVASIDGRVDWYPMPTPGCLWLDIPDLPKNLNIIKYVPPNDMPSVYKKYKAMVMIGEGALSRGLSLSILEAQASGVAVIAPSLRPDFDAFVTKGGGYIFNDVSEIPEILKNIPNQARREMGFEHASHYDISGVEQEFMQAGFDF